MIDRRTFCAATAAAALLPLTAADAAAQAAGFQMWHSPGCGCCLEWARRIQAEFRRPLRVIETGDMATLKRANGIPADLQSCHTARVAGVLVEGHVPPADIRRLIRSGNPRRLALAVPGMPAGSPGMDVGHNHRQPYSVFAFDSRGRRSLFARHGG